MENNALLYEILINKAKLKPLNSNDLTVPEVAPKDFSLVNRIVDEKHFACDTSEPTEAIQFFTQECLASKTVCNNKDAFGAFLKAEVPLLLNKFEKTIVGKVE